MTACLIVDSGLNGSVALWLWEADDLSALASYLCLKGERGLGVRAFLREGCWSLDGRNCHLEKQ